MQRFNLESLVGHREGCTCGGGGQGATTRNSGSIARSCNAAMRRHKCAIRGVTLLTHGVNVQLGYKLHISKDLSNPDSGQLRILGRNTTSL